MARRLFAIVSALSLLLGVAALALWAWSPGRLFRLDHECRYVLYSTGGRLSLMHFEYFSAVRPHGDERDAWGAVCLRQVHLGAVAAGAGVMPLLWCCVVVRDRTRIPSGCGRYRGSGEGT